MNDDHPTAAAATDATIYTCPMHAQVRQDHPGKCPKCGMFLVPVGAADLHGADHGHKAQAAAASGGTYDTVPTGWSGPVYTCPMHPQVRQTGPGSCPICGMGLELESAAMGDAGPNPELVDFTRRFWAGVALTIPLLVLTMSPLVGLPQIREFFGQRAALWLEVALASPVIGWSGWPFFVRGWTSFRTMKLNMFSLISMGILRARRLSMATMRNIRQNLFFALIYNGVGVPIAAGILYPFLGILIGPIFAAFAMSASSISVVLNALRLRAAKI